MNPRGGGPARPPWRAVDGIVLLDKPLGLSSNQALQRVRRLYRAAKAGHTGSLDPLASGMLPVCFGQATKVCAYLLDSDKVYRARLALGARTASGDAEGEPVERAAVPADVEARLPAAVAGLHGPIDQVPPMYSALKVGGERLYALARAGLEVERAARTVEILALSARFVAGDAAQAPVVEFTVHCSKGTYVRTLGEDLARALGTVGHLCALERVWVAPFRDAPMHTLAALEGLAGDEAALDRLLLPPARALPDWPVVPVDAAAERDLRHGRSIGSPLAPAAQERRVLLVHNEVLVALGSQAPGAAQIAPFRLLTPAAGL